MKIKDLKQEEIDAMSYDDLAYMVLNEQGKKMKINDLFKKVCKLMNLDDSVFESKIADFFELLSTDRKFIMLENGYWDLRDKHSDKVKLNTVEDEVISSEEIDDIELDDEEDEEEDIFFEGEETDDESENDLKDLVVIDEDEEANS